MEKIKENNIRNGYIDLLRGVAILIVVFAHAIQSCNMMLSTDPVHVIIQTFQMPLMMIISGYTSGFGEPVQNITVAITKKTKRLLIPYLVWIQIHFIISAIISKQYNFMAHVKNLFISQFWFLRILFVTFLIYYLFYFVVGIKKLKKPLNFVLAFMICVGSIILLRFIPGCETLITFAVCFLAGNMLYKAKHIFQWKWIRVLHWFSIPLFAASVAIYFLFPNKNITFLLDKSMAFIGSACIASISYFFYKKLPVTIIKAFKAIGNNTLPIYAIHWVFFFSFNINPFVWFANLNINIYFSAFIVFLIWLVACDLLIRLLRKSDVCRLLLLGEAKNKSKR